MSLTMISTKSGSRPNSSSSNRGEKEEGGGGGNNADDAKKGASSRTQITNLRCAKRIYTKETLLPWLDININEYKTWVYLFYNCLVCLPTGLGKTFIGAVVIYNYLRWFPKGKIIFTAPTKPLVNQQVEACYKITGIDPRMTCVLTGTTSVNARRKLYENNRLFFMTPETFRNDLENDLINAQDVSLVVFDEAHKATGNYAYCQIVNELTRNKAVFRVLALTATPGNDLSKVQEVVQNLHIEKIQTRTEDSMDVVKFIHHKEIQEILVPLEGDIAKIAKMLAVFVEACIKKLNQGGGYAALPAEKASTYGMMMARIGWVKTKKNALSRAMQTMMESEYALGQVLVGLYQALVNCGINLFEKKLSTFMQETRQKTGGASKTRLELVDHNAHFKKMVEYTKEVLKKENFVSHPKISSLIEVVLEHFKDHAKRIKKRYEKRMETRRDEQEGGSGKDIGIIDDEDDDFDSETRVMIFTTYRDTVNEITDDLKKLSSPDVRPTFFVGQAKTKDGGGMKQKDQLEVLKKFKKGIFNVLVATCIGEEGLDIGELDLIICFDNQKSSIRMLQRCGRTGRKRNGKVCLLVSPGKEQKAVELARGAYKSVQKSISDKELGNLNFYNGDLAGIIPEGLEAPVCDQQNIIIPEIDIYEGTSSTSNAKRGVTKGESPYLDSAQETSYISKYLTPLIEIPPVSLIAYPHLQTEQLPKFKVPRSDRSAVFTSLMCYCEELKLEEFLPVRDIKCGNEDPQFADNKVNLTEMKRSNFKFEPLSPINMSAKKPTTRVLISSECSDNDEEFEKDLERDFKYSRKTSVSSKPATAIEFSKPKSQRSNELIILSSPHSTGDARPLYELDDSIVILDSIHYNNSTDFNSRSKGKEPMSYYQQPPTCQDPHISTTYQKSPKEGQMYHQSPSHEPSQEQTLQKIDYISQGYDASDLDGGWDDEALANMDLDIYDTVAIKEEGNRPLQETGPFFEARSEPFGTAILQEDFSVCGKYENAPHEEYSQYESKCEHQPILHTKQEEVEDPISDHEEDNFSNFQQSLYVKSEDDPIISDYEDGTVRSASNLHRNANADPIVSDDEDKLVEATRMMKRKIPNNEDDPISAEEGPSALDLFERLPFQPAFKNKFPSPPAIEDEFPLSELDSFDLENINQLERESYTQLSNIGGFQDGEIGEFSDGDEVIPPTPPDNESELGNSLASSPSFIARVPTRRNILVSSSSATGHNSIPDKEEDGHEPGSGVPIVRTPLLVTRMRRQTMKRPPPMIRGSPKLTTTNNTSKRVKVVDEEAAKQNLIRKRMAEAQFMDMEVDVSSGEVVSSDEEGSYLDKDLSGFIEPVRESQGNTFGTQLAYDNALALEDDKRMEKIYLESLVKEGRKEGPKYRLAKRDKLLRPIRLSGEGGAPGSSEGDSLYSLADFLVDGDEDDEFFESEEEVAVFTDDIEREEVLREENSPVNSQIVENLSYQLDQCSGSQGQSSAPIESQAIAESFTKENQSNPSIISPPSNPSSTKEVRIVKNAADLTPSDLLADDFPDIDELDLPDLLDF